MKEFIEIPATKQSLAKRKPINGLGINDANYNVFLYAAGKITGVCPYYIVWTRMLERCYSSKFQSRQPTYKGCLVVKEWLTFSNFRAWMEDQDWRGKQLDKDLLVAGNKEYGPDYCIFISSQANSLLSDCAASRGKYPKGVSFNKNADAFTARCSVNGVVKHIGLFGSAKSAEIAYLKFKIAIVREFACAQDSIVKVALLSAASRMNERLISLI